MGVDLSRIRSNPLLDFSDVQLKQGGVVLDADFNEFAAIVDRRIRAAASDILGPARVSSTTPDAFKITAVGSSLTIGRGRLYVDGLLAENHGAVSTTVAKQRFDSLLAEPAFTDDLKYDAQPYLPSAPKLPTTGRHLVYLDVWQREVTQLEDPDLVEIAVGVETSARTQTVWQVRVLDGDAANASCASPDEDVPGWTALTAPSGGRLTTDTFEVPPEKDPCELPPTGGYRGLENQSYRIEIHDGGTAASGATFKWSRENASVASRVSSLVSATEMELVSLGRDDVLRFNTGDWVEILDDVREFSQLPGEMRRITINEAARRITFTPSLPTAMLPGTFPNTDFPASRNLRVRRWDQAHKVLQTGAGSSTSVYQDLDAGSSGVIKLSGSGTTLLLENGVTVRFETVGGGAFRPGDFWVFAARTADASVEKLKAAPPRGIHHHYARLGFWDIANSTAGASAGSSVTDCRLPWPPATGGDDCSCTVCVTPESHASGRLTIQTAVDRLHDTGGTVCLGVGVYGLRQAVQLKGTRAVRIRGQGFATRITCQGTAFAINNALALAIEDLAIIAIAAPSDQTPVTEEPAAAAGTDAPHIAEGIVVSHPKSSTEYGAAIAVQGAYGLSLQRLAVLVIAASGAKVAAISLDGIVLGATIADNLIVAPVGVIAATSLGRSEDDGARQQVLLTALMRIEDNLLWCQDGGVILAGKVLHLLSNGISGNALAGCRIAGMQALGLGAPGASMRICGNDLDITGSGIAAGVSGLWIEGNKLSVSAGSSNTVAARRTIGIALRTGFDPSGVGDCQILANQISGFGAAGIAIGAASEALIIKLNIIDLCGSGIISIDDADARSVAIENNQIRDIGNALESETGEISGISVLRAQGATIAGNMVRNVGTKATQASLCAGIATGAVQHLRVSGNDITDIAPPGDFRAGIGAGLLVRPAFTDVVISHNRIDRESKPLSEGGGQFSALMTALPDSEGPVNRVGDITSLQVGERKLLIAKNNRAFFSAAIPATLEAGDVAAVATAAAVATDATTSPTVPSGPSASILGNIFGSRGRLPAVQFAAAGDLLFNDNRCELRGNTSKVAVQLDGGAVIVNANRIRGGGEFSLLLEGDPKTTVVLGNITTREISPLSAPWAALNLRA